ncbi:ATP synthase F1 subunit delta [Candidatus Cardinium hertigii]|uniref:ATP synthase F1 subunit delta n=1 Tax=Candidatus Cardinium hertigii TaxID=247481 RepID=UPI003D7C6B96
MLKKKKIAARYANLLLAQAIQENLLTSIHNDLSFLQNQFKDYPLLDGLLNNPTIHRSGKRKLLEKICTHPLIPMVWRFIEIIIDQNQIGLLKEISTAFGVAYRSHMGIQSALLTTATALPKALIKQLAEEVKKWVSCKEVIMQQHIDPSIIGGYILQMGTLKLDRSIQHALHTLQKRLG